jgi:hypothetical protein
VDRDLVASAYRKVMDSKELTKPERAALKRHEKEKEERLRCQHYVSIPQKHWRQMSGRQTKVINEQAARYGIPFGGATINLPAVVRALHDFLADNAVKLARDDDALMQGNGSPALERYREERTALVRLDRMEREGQLLPRDEAREVLGRITPNSSVSFFRPKRALKGGRFGSARGTQEKANRGSGAVAKATKRTAESFRQRSIELFASSPNECAQRGTGALSSTLMNWPRGRSSTLPSPGMAVARQ